MWDCAVGSYAPQSWRDLIAQALASGQNKSIDVECAEKVYSFFVAPVVEAGYVNLYGRDITERKRAEEALHFTRFSVDSAADTMVCVARDARFVNVNDAFCRSVGYSRKELLSMTVHDIDPDYSAEVWPEFWKKLKQSGSLTFETYHRSKEGQVYPVEITATWFEYDGKEYHSGFARDITERKRAEEALRKSEEKFRHLFNNAEVGMFRTRLDGSEVLEFNERYLKILGYTADEVKGKPSVDMWADKRKRDRMVQQLQAEGHATDLECDLLNKQGEVINCVTSVRLYRDAGILEGSIMDITERKRAEDELARSHQLMTALNQVAAHLQTSLVPDTIMETLGAELKPLGWDCAVTSMMPDGKSAVVRYMSFECACWNWQKS